MPPLSSVLLLRRSLPLGFAAMLAGCSLLQPHPKAPPPPPPVVAAPSEPEPVATQHFELAADQDLIGQLQVVRATKDDTLTDIARRFNVGYEEMLRANPDVDPWLPGADREIVVPSQFVLPDAPRQGVVINIAEMRLYYYPPHKKSEPQVVITHPIGIGKVGWATPEGVTRIVRRQKDPIWRVPVSVIKEHRENGEELERSYGPGPDNPLGRYAFYLDWPSYLIHGTNKPAGVGLRSSHGCIRLFPEDIEQLFDMIPVGTQVRVVNQPYVFGWSGGQLYMQSFGALEDDGRDWKRAERKLLDRALTPAMRKRLKSRGLQLDWDQVTALAHKPRGIAVPVTAAGTRLEQVLAAAPRVQNRLPAGSSWDGKSDLPMDEGTFRQMLSEMQPGTEMPAAALPPGSGAAPAAAGAGGSPHARSPASAGATAGPKSGS